MKSVFHIGFEGGGTEMHFLAVSHFPLYLGAQKDCSPALNDLNLTFLLTEGAAVERREH